MKSRFAQLCIVILLLFAVIAFKNYGSISKPALLSKNTSPTSYDSDVDLGKSNESNFSSILINNHLSSISKVHSIDTYSHSKFINTKDQITPRKNEKFELGLLEIGLSNAEIFTTPWLDSLVEAEPEFLYENGILKGVVLNQILAGSIFERLKLERGDVIRGFNSESFINPIDFTLKLGEFLMLENNSRLWFERNHYSGEIVISETNKVNFENFTTEEIHKILKIWNKDMDNLETARYLVDIVRGVTFDGVNHQQVIKTVFRDKSDLLNMNSQVSSSFLENLIDILT
jgi:hypothetical protein